MSQQSLTLPATGSAAGRTKAQRNRRLLELGGAAAIAATYLFLVLTQPADIANGPASFPALVALGGFLLGAVLLIAAALPALPTSTLVLMPVALVLNVVLGQLMGTTGLPFYVDAIGTVLIAVLAGPAAGAATGALSTIVWSFINPTVLPFAAGAALIGFLAGLAARSGLFRRFYLAPVAGFVTGILAGVVSAPIAAFVFGGTAGPRHRSGGQRVPRDGRHPARRHHQAGVDLRPHGQGHCLRYCRPAGLCAAAAHHLPVPVRPQVPGARR